jgi:peptide/nickel transport system permease protein
VTEELREKFPATIELALAATAIATALGLVLGVGAAVRPRGLIDGATSVVALTGISIPVFWLGLLLQIAIAPLTGRDEAADMLEPEQVRTGLLLIDTALAGNWEYFGHALQHLALPAIALSTVPLATIARMTRASMLEALSQDFVRTAKAKGLSASAVVLKHALRNALIPIVTASGLHLAALLGGAVLTESVFSWPGIGSYIYESATKKDLPALQGAVLVVAVVYVVLNLIVDVSYGLIDPRVREA